MSLLAKLSTWVADRLLQFGLIEDELLNTELLGGAANMTVSTHSALAWRRERESGKYGWGCFMCQIVLRICVNKTHCADTLAKKPIPTLIAIKAWAFISVALALLAAIPTLPILWACGVL